MQMCVNVRKCQHLIIFWSELFILLYGAPASHDLNVLLNHKFTFAINLDTLQSHSAALYLIYAYEISPSAFGMIFVWQALNLKLFHSNISSHFSPSAALVEPLFSFSFPWTTPQSFFFLLNEMSPHINVFIFDAVRWIRYQAVAVVINS